MRNVLLRAVSSVFIIALGVGILYFDVVKNVFAVALFLGSVYELIQFKPVRKITVVYTLFVSLCCLNVLFLNKSFVFYTLVLAWAHDVGGYVFGKLLKGHKIAPSISPNKTWFGFMGSWIFILGVAFFQAGFKTFSKTEFALTFVWTAFALLGDLAESKVKRIYGVKDSGALIPGHGGVLDRFDSLYGLLFAFGLIEFGKWILAYLI